MLQAARDMVNLKIPLIGINLGTLGFLAEVDRQSVYPALDKLIRDEYELEERMMLHGTVYHGEEMAGEDIALNDIVIYRNGHMRIMSLINYVNNEYLNSYTADGIILATPTGSTGYALSVGGPIVSPSAKMTIMTPIAAHTLNTRSIVFPAKDVISVFVWLAANLINIVLILVLGLIVTLLIRGLIRDRRAGASPCGGNCAGCGACAMHGACQAHKP